MTDRQTNKRIKRQCDFFEKYNDAFSLSDEIGTCQQMVAQLELNHKMPFSVSMYS